MHIPWRQHHRVRHYGLAHALVCVFNSLVVRLILSCCSTHILASSSGTKVKQGMLSSVSPKGQITIPVAIRRLLGVKPKDTVAFAIKDGQVTISPARFSLESAFGSLEPPRGVENFDRLIAEAKEDNAPYAVEQVQEV